MFPFALILILNTRVFRLVCYVVNPEKCLKRQHIVVFESAEPSAPGKRWSRRCRHGNVKRGCTQVIEFLFALLHVLFVRPINQQALMSKVSDK